MITAVVVAGQLPDIGSELNIDTFRKVGTPSVYVPTNAINIGVGETLTINGTLALNGLVTGGVDFIEAIIDGGHADSVYASAFNLDGGGA
jgi:hypothetical protein